MKYKHRGIEDLPVPARTVMQEGVDNGQVISLSAADPTCLHETQLAKSMRASIRPLVGRREMLMSSSGLP